MESMSEQSQSTSFMCYDYYIIYLFLLMSYPNRVRSSLLSFCRISLCKAEWESICTLYTTSKILYLNSTAHPQSIMISGWWVTWLKNNKELSDRQCWPVSLANTANQSCLQTGCPHSPFMGYHTKSNALEFISNSCNCEADLQGRNSIVV